MRRRKRAYARIKTGFRFTDRLRLLIYFFLSVIIPWSLCYRFKLLHDFMNLAIRGIQIKRLGYVWEMGHFRDFVTVDPRYERPINFWFNHGSEVFLDVGAYIGRYSIILNNRFKKIYAFEPSWDTVKRLRKNIALNEIDNIVALKFALMNRSGFMRMNVKYTPGTNSLINEDNLLGHESVETLRLDELFISGKIDLIKVDIEGAEKDFLMGAEKTIRENKPRLIMEIEAENLDFVNGFLSALGYSEELTCSEYGETYHCYDWLSGGEING